VETYRSHWEEYARTAEAVRATIKKVLDANGIMAIVSARAKDPDRLKGKLLRIEGERGRPFATEDEIREVIHDLVGARIALYFPGDSMKIAGLLALDFLCYKSPKVFPPKVPGFDDLIAQGCTAHKRKIYPGYDSRRFDGYHATHHYIRQRTPLSGRIPNPDIEVQVASVLMHAWSEVEHDLAYKKMTGNVSREEYECLDEINGLVIAGEIALNRLQALSKQRIRELDAFDSPISLQLYLTDRQEQRSRSLAPAAEEQDMGNVKQLFEMYREAGMLTPAQLENQLKRLPREGVDSVNSQVRMLIDQFSDEKRQKAKQVTVDNIMQYLQEDESFYTSARIGMYLTKWNALEDLVRSAVKSLGRKCSNSTMSWKAVVEEQALGPEAGEIYHSLRLQRNTIVHTNRLPGEEKFRQLMEDMDNLSSRLKTQYNLK
jgi:ppGpp synthetase/RelA/SpoT-type nucleotidyltranferase